MGIAIDEWHGRAGQGTSDISYLLLPSKWDSVPNTVSAKTKIPGFVIMSLWSRRLACLHARGHAQLYLAVSVMSLAIHGREWGKVCRQTLSSAGKFASILPPSEVSFLSVHAFMLCAYVCECMYMLTTASKWRSEVNLRCCLYLALWDRVSSSLLYVLNQLPDKHLGLLCLYLSFCRRIVLRGVCYCIWLPVGFEAQNLGPPLWQLFQMLFERSCWVWKELIGALNLVSLGSFLGV